MKPATALPWVSEFEKYKAKLIADERHEASGAGLRAKMVTTRRQIAMHGNPADARVKEDFQYIVHTANAYPKLVEALRAVLAKDGYGLRTTGELPARALLRELGEDA